MAALRGHILKFSKWPNRDPLEELGAQNLYSFNLNSTIGRIDTDGRQSIATPAGQEALVIAVGEEAAAEVIGAAAARAAAARIAARAAAAAAAGVGSCPPPRDPCEDFRQLRNTIRNDSGLNHLLNKASDVIKAGGSQADLNAIPGMQDGIRQLLADMYEAAADCNPSNPNSWFNRERARFLRGERSTGPGSPRNPIPEG